MTSYVIKWFHSFHFQLHLSFWCFYQYHDGSFLFSGWMDQVSFYEWFQQIFLHRTQRLPRPLLLFVDGHGSHCKVETLKLALDNVVYVIKGWCFVRHFLYIFLENKTDFWTFRRIIACLPSNAAHILQPLWKFNGNSTPLRWYIIHSFLLEFWRVNMSVQITTLKKKSVFYET